MQPDDHPHNLLRLKAADCRRRAQELRDYAEEFAGYVTKHSLCAIEWDKDAEVYDAAAERLQP